MFDSNRIVTGLDIGTSKICAIVGEVNETGHLSIIGIGQAKSRGVRKGEIVDFNQAVDDIRNAIVEAEQTSDAEIRSVYLGVTGNHIHGFNNRGFHPVASHDREIIQDDVEDALKNARAINIPADHRILHLVRQHFIVDGQEGILNPVGMFGARVEVDVHVIHGSVNRLQTPVKAVKALNLDVDEVTFSGIASAIAILTNEQKELGSLVIDLGGGVTNYMVYTRGAIKHAGVLGVGGDHVSNDLAYGLKVPLGKAEQLKIDYGSAIVDDTAMGATIGVSNEKGIHERNVNLEHLRRIMSARLEEIFEIIAAKLDEAGALDQVREGVFLCGGGAHIPEIKRLASKVFGLPAFIAQSYSISTLKTSLQQPEFSTAIGLAKCASFEQKRKLQKKSISGKLAELTGFFGRK